MLVAYPGPQRVAILPSVVRILLPTFLGEIAATDRATRAGKKESS